MIYTTHQPVEGKFIQPNELSKVLHYTAVSQTGWKRKPLPWCEFSPTTYAKEVCYMKLMGESSPTMYTVNSYYDKVMGEFSPTMYTMKVLHLSHV